MEFLGNEKAKSTLDSMVKSGRFPHAFLLCGENGVGKKTFAHIMAKALLCEGENKPCNSCDCCKKIDLRSHPDVEVITKKEKDSEFKIDYVREIISRAYISPNEASRRVFILAQADKMNISAQNALLKIIEEPPETAVFILTAQNREKLLPTILSRTVTIPLSPVSEEAAKDYVKSKHPDADAELFEVYGGNIGKILLAIQNENEKDELDVAFSIVKSLEDKDRYTTLKILSTLNQRKAERIFLKTAQVLESTLFKDNTPSRVWWLSQIVWALDTLKLNANFNILTTQLCIKLYDI